MRRPSASVGPVSHFTSRDRRSVAVQGDNEIISVVAHDEQRHFGECLWQGWRLGWKLAPLTETPLAPAMAQGSPMRPQFSGEGHLRKPCHSCWSWGTGSNLGRGLLLQLFGLPTGGRPWVSWVTEQPAPKSFWGYPRGRLPLQVGVRPPLLSPLQSVSSFLGPPGQHRLSGGASQLPEASMWEQQNAFEKGLRCQAALGPHRVVWQAAEKPIAPGSWTEKWVSVRWGGQAPVLKFPPCQPQ